MDLLDYIKSRWNLVLGVSLSIVVVVTGFLVPPQFTSGMPISRSNFSSLAKFIVAGILLLVLVPCAIFNKRKHLWYWWAGAILLFAAAFFLFFHYQSDLDHKTAYDEYSDRQLIIGNTLTSLAQRAVDSVKQADGLEGLSAGEMLATLGPPESIWPKQQIEDNARSLVITYLVTLSLFALFVLFAIQATYCSISERAGKNSP